MKHVLIGDFFFLAIVNAINPVAIRTPLFETSGGLIPEQAEAFFDSFKNIYPVGRVGECTDTTAAIEFLVNDSTASFITGLLLPVSIFFFTTAFLCRYSFFLFYSSFLG